MHRDRLALADLCPNPIKKVHTRTAGREIAFDLGVPFAAISLGKPVQKGHLLFG